MTVGKFQYIMFRYEQHFMEQMTHHGCWPGRHQELSCHLMKWSSWYHKEPCQDDQKDVRGHRCHPPCRDQACTLGTGVTVQEFCCTRHRDGTHR
ncbi:hypothetical protein DAI22_12g192100 [Oryza sativa Japonica Group]|nr:hypothetical protein DAI22_12g192100 [Oryza sativa Japonica Group]